MISRDSQADARGPVSGCRSIEAGLDSTQAEKRRLDTQSGV